VHERAQAAVIAAEVEDLGDDRAILALELVGLDARRVHVGPLVDVDAEPAVRIDVGGAGDAAMKPGQDGAAAPARQPQALADLGDRRRRSRIRSRAGARGRRAALHPYRPAA